MEENLQKLSPNQQEKKLDEKIQKSPPQKWISKILKKKTPPKKNNNAKYNHKQILDNCKKKIRLFLRENLSQILSITPRYRTPLKKDKVQTNDLIISFFFYDQYKILTKPLTIKKKRLFKQKKWNISPLVNNNKNNYKPQ